MTKKPQDLANAAAATLLEARRVLEQWQRRLADVEAAVVQAAGTSGVALLDDPEAAESWPARMRELRDQVVVAERSLAAQTDRVRAAERDWLSAQAVLIEVSEVLPAHKALEAHLRRTSELLAALEAHDGPYVPQLELARAQRTAGVLVEGAVAGVLPRSHGHRAAVVRAEIRHRVLCAMATGEDPAPMVAARQFQGEISEDDCYPEGVGASGLVAAPAAAARVSRLRDQVAELEGLSLELEREISDLPHRADRERWEPGVLESAMVRRQSRIEDIPAELAASRAELEQLVGGAALVGESVEVS